MEFVLVESGNSVLIEKVYSILEAAGTYMAENSGLMHWKPPYPIERIADDTATKQVYLAKSGEDYVATFTLSDDTLHVFESLPDEGAVYLSKFAVNPNIMNSGIGSACMHFIEDLCKKRNKTRLRFDVYNKSTHAIKFYLKMGYKELPLATDLVICMEKVL